MENQFGKINLEFKNDVQKELDNYIAGQLYYGVSGKRLFEQVETLQCKIKDGYIRKLLLGEDGKYSLDNLGRVYLFTHYDADGLGAGVVLNVAGKNQFNFISRKPSANYVKKLIEDGKIDNYDTLIITDLAPDSDTADFIEEWAKENNKKILLLDHHSTASTLELNKREWCNVIPSEYRMDNRYEKYDILSSGTLLTYAAFEPYIKTSPSVLAMLKIFAIKTAIYDNFYFKTEFGKLTEIDFAWKTCKILNTYATVFGGQKYIYEVSENIIYSDCWYSDKMNLIYDIKTAENEDMFKKFEGQVRIVDYNLENRIVRVGLIYLSNGQTSFSEYFFDKYETVDILIMMNPNTGSMAIRANNNNDIDACKLIAEKVINKDQKPGGHPKACGAIFTENGKEYTSGLNNSMKLFLGACIGTLNIEDKDKISNIYKQAEVEGITVPEIMRREDF